ncbi:MAG: hypothetical protein IJJ78_00215 [Paludibacteraceae bacterium]|nr:hypothetical protein [Paludibacteraceae bacterium]
MEKNYVEENEKILDAWEQEYKNRGKNICFSRDGIMFRGLFENIEGYWVRERGNENELWSKSPVRILYLTKDQNAGEDHDDYWDCRASTFHRRFSKKEDDVLCDVTAFNTNFSKSLYGLATTTPDKMVEYDDIDEKEVVKVCDEYPYAQINCKKEAGGAKCSDAVLDAAMKEYAPFLKQQILNLDADIIVCSGGWRGNANEDVMVNFLNSIGYNFERDKDCGNYVFHYDETHNKVAISAYHLGFFAYGRKQMYDDIVKTYYLFLQKYPDFIKSHRK